MYFVFVQGTWDKKIIECVNNTRKRLASPDSPRPQAKRGRPKVHGVLACYPPVDTEFDEVAHLHNMQALDKELERANSRKDAILPLMRETFSGRRQHILSEDSEVSYTSTIRDYPALALPYVVRSLLTKICVYGICNPKPER